ncbi:MAG: translation initiation factor IF-2 subunit beta [Nanoarchaeota archaeon]|nr:translation initiation factor IF-2 subunit beta [Nanoarchaeota archaeon]
METYEQMLEEAYKKIKPVETKIERFEIPKIEGHIEGTKTILTNVQQIADYVRRNINHFLKYLLREFATSGKIEGNRVILQTKIPSMKINDKIKQYVEEFVICRECGKPDTQLIKQDKFMFVQCLACGAKHSVRAKI